MGNKHVKEFVVIVLGLKNVGKTHFIDKFIYNNDTTKVPTNGYYDTKINFQDNVSITLIEYGSAISWKQFFHTNINHVIMIIDVTYTVNQLREAKSALAMALLYLPDKIPISIVFKGTIPPPDLKPIITTLQLFDIAKDHDIFYLFINFDEKKSWQEGVSNLFKWIVQAFPQNY